MYIQNQRGGYEMAGLDVMARAWALGWAEAAAQGYTNGYAAAYARGYANGYERGRRELALEIAQNLHGIGLDKRQIAAATGLDIADLDSLSE